MVSRPKLIIVDGPDRVGKSTTLEKVWKARGKIDSCIDRGILSNLVYNKVFDRKVLDVWYENLMPNSSDVFYIYFECSSEVLKMRAEDTNDDEYSSQEIADQQQLFFKKFHWLKKMFFNVNFITVNTELFTQEEVVEFILKKINEVL